MSAYSPFNSFFLFSTLTSYSAAVVVESSSHPKIS